MLWLILGCTSIDTSNDVVTRDGKFSIIYTGGMNGEIEPCG